MPKYLVEISRIAYATEEFYIEAVSPQEAEATAHDLCGDRIFDEHSSEYQTNSVVEIK